MLDLAISMALVYMMMAGLVSGVQEWIASMLQLRGKQLQRGVASLLHEAMTTQPPKGGLLERVYSHPFINALSDDKGRRPSYIPSSHFALALADELVREQGVHQPLFQGLPEAVARMPDSPLKRSLQALVNQAGGQAQALQAALEGHFNDVMNRVSGWYKRQTQWIAFGLALALSVGLNIDTLGLLHYLKSHPEVAVRVAEQAAATVNAANASASSPMPPNLAQSRKILEDLQAKQIPLGWTFEKDRMWPKWPDGGALVVVGWLITALAATLGAPFWFDLLQRLVPLRGSGSAPKPTLGSAGAAPAAQSPPPAAEAQAAPAPAAAVAAPLAATSGARNARNDFEANRLNEVDLAALQTALGLTAADCTGLLDDATRAALRHWQLSVGRPGNGEFDADAVALLLDPPAAAGSTASSAG